MKTSSSFPAPASCGDSKGNATATTENPFPRMRYIIIGGVAGGATAAARIRRNTEQAEIILFEKGEYISYANCGLPYYIGGVITDRDKLFVQTPEAFARRFNIDVRTNSEVIAIDLRRKAVTIRRSDRTEYSEPYDKLLLSPGASPVVPPLQGIHNKGIFTLRNVTDTDAIKAYISENNAHRAVIVGGGFIGLEMAENLHHAGLDVSVVEMAEQVMGPIDFSMAALVHEHLLQKGIHLYLGQAVEAFEPDGTALNVRLKSGMTLTADLVLLSIGVRPETGLASAAGIALGAMRGIQVNGYLQTSDPDVYAVGDAIEFTHPLTDSPWLNFLAGPANRQARIVADNMVFGNTLAYEGSIGTSIAKVFDLTVAATGLPAKRLRQMDIPCLSATIHTNAHAGYYPNALQMSIKITFSPTDGRLYGAQIVGSDGVDKRIDEYALIIKNQGTIHHLTRLEHAYAPPFSSAKDPVAVSGYVASNILSDKMSPIYWRELAQQLATATPALIDVRTPDEFALGTIPGAVNLPLDDLRSRLADIPTHRPIVLFCGVGLRGYLASNILKDNGFTNVRNLIGGLKTFKAATAKIPLPTNNHTMTDNNTTPTSLPIAPSTPNAAPSATPNAAPNATPSATPHPAPQVIRIDACGLQCPGPILKLKKSIESAPSGSRLEIHATDPGFLRDAEAWCRTTGNRLLSSSSASGICKVLIEKPATCETTTLQTAPNAAADGKTLILFSDDLDKALATFVLANGAAATGRKVSIFFTFWGLNAIKKERKPFVTKDLFGKMFSLMLPSSSRKLALSKMNMGGIGAKMMRHIMRAKGIDSLESLRQQAIDNGVEFIACQMSMDVMGVKKEELLDNVTIGGVATYMERAVQSNVNLFI